MTADAAEDADLIRRMRTLCAPLEPIPTGEEPRLTALPEIRAVLFDVYGTLVVSGSGDIGVSGTTFRAEAFEAACRAAGLTCRADASEAVALLRTTIVRFQEQLREQGIDFPEVDIPAVWRAVLERLGVSLPADECRRDHLLRCVAVEFECRTNPVWPMPGAAGVLRELRDRGNRLGLISNAQFYTPLMLEALFGESLDGLGIEPALCFYSYRFGRAKPGVFLYEQARQRLAAEGIGAKNTLYVGNDLRNDVLPARQVGFRTALFAGDRRSLRKREDDPQMQGVVPDVVLTDWNQLMICLSPPEEPDL